MKALVCGACADVRALPSIPPYEEWTTCRCGNVSARWVDPRAGRAEFKAKDPGNAFVMGLHNGVFGPASQGRLAMFEDFRAAHEAATDAPGYVFDKSRAACWAVIFRIGHTSDTAWAEDASD